MALSAASRYATPHLGFFVLQHPAIAFSGGTIDPARLAEGWLAEISPQTTRPDGVRSVE